MRLEWQRSPYNSENGNAGGIPLFGISWRTQRDKPDWSMHTQLPGLAGETWEHDDKDTLKERAERVLDQWLTRVNGEG